MRNVPQGKESGTKRDVDTAFGEEARHSPKQKNQKHSKLVKQKQQEQSCSNSKPETPKEKTSKLRNEFSSPPPTTKPSSPNDTSDSRRTKGHGAVQTEEQTQQFSTKGPIKRRRKRDSRWTLSAAEGGRFISHDALLLLNDRYMALAVPTQMLVYSTASSMLFRSLKIEDHDRVTSFMQSRSNPHHLFVSTYSGILLKWDWTTGQTFHQWRSSPKLLCVTDQVQSQKDCQPSSFLLIHEDSSHDCRLALATLSESLEDAVDEEILLQYQSSSSYIKYFHQARCLILYGNDKLILGQAARKSEATRSSYIWREIAVPRSITCIDARSHRLGPGVKRADWAIDIVIGCRDGSILIYDDVLSRLAGKEKNAGQDALVSRRFHWHRNEVLAVKWSLDGNYLISGGHETVVVIWQLDTGHQQFLPHLSSAVQNLTISPTGTSYAIHLADNSVVVLSTSELQPTAYVGGLSLRMRRRLDKAAQKIPAAIHPTDPAFISLAVPADDPVNFSNEANATLLQTYDVQRYKHTARQALVRNQITALRVDPSGRPIQEPNVIHLKISPDGRWLVTVDEWRQPRSDSECLDPGDEDSPPLKKEICLKFWSKNESSRSWELVTKIESPHLTAEKSSDSILDLQSNPQRTEFATVSAGGSVYIWTPKRRHRNGLPITDQSGSTLHSWTRTHSIEVPTGSSLDQPIRSSLAYSHDGSVLAAASNKTPFVTFMDPRAGIVRHTQRGAHPGVFSQLSFLDHHLIAIGQDLRVYNAVSGDLLWALALDSTVRDVLLAVNEADKTFSIAFVLSIYRSASKDKSNQGRNVRSQITVFQPHNVSPLHNKILDRKVDILLPLQKQSGYLVIDDEAEIFRLQRPGTAVVAKTADRGSFFAEDPESSNSTTAAALALKDLKADWLALQDAARNNNNNNTETAQQLRQQREEQTPILQTTYKTHASLADVFDQSTIDMSVRTLFDNVFAALRGERSKLHRE